jgi:hypothetical protein
LVILAIGLFVWLLLRKKHSGAGQDPSQFGI